MNKNLKRALGGGVILVGLFGASVFAASTTNEVKDNASLKVKKGNHSQYAMVKHVDKSSLSEEELEALKEKFALREEKKKSKQTSGDTASGESESETSSKKTRKQRIKKHRKEEVEENEKATNDSGETMKHSGRKMRKKVTSGSDETV
ncbi:MAG: hypothetical protein IJ220_01810 [Clostridia bacterium]|nr:hypothetical protein [Clostridia bacterium]